MKWAIKRFKEGMIPTLFLRNWEVSGQKATDLEPEVMTESP